MAKKPLVNTPASMDAGMVINPLRPLLCTPQSGNCVSSIPTMADEESMHSPRKLFSFSVYVNQYGLVDDWQKSLTELFTHGLTAAVGKTFSINQICTGGSYGRARALNPAFHSRYTSDDRLNTKAHLLLPIISINLFPPGSGLVNQSEFVSHLNKDPMSLQYLPPLTDCVFPFQIFWEVKPFIINIVVLK